MNQIQEKDWADESWHGHTGMDSSCDYCIINDTTAEQPEEPSGTAAARKGGGKGVKKPNNRP